MSRHYSKIFISASFGLILSACGGGSADFKAAITAQCEKEDKTTDCACAADILDKELDGKAKSLLVALFNGQSKGSSQDDILKETGMSKEEAGAIMMTAMPALMSAAEKCKKT